MSSDHDYIGEYGRECDRAKRVEADLPPAGQPSRPGPTVTPADLDAAFGIGQRPTTAAAERRQRDQRG